MARVCAEFHTVLSSNNSTTGGEKRIPPASLVRVDTGKSPSALPSLTLPEPKLLAATQPSRDLFMMNPSGRQNRPHDAYQAHWTGHVFAFPQALRGPA